MRKVHFNWGIHTFYVAYNDKNELCIFSVSATHAEEYITSVNSIWIGQAHYSTDFLTNLKNAVREFNLDQVFQ